MNFNLWVNISLKVKCSIYLYFTLFFCKKVIIESFPFIRFYEYLIPLQCKRIFPSSSIGSWFSLSLCIMWWSERCGDSLKCSEGHCILKTSPHSSSHKQSLALLHTCLPPTQMHVHWIYKAVFSLPSGTFRLNVLLQ